MPFFLAATLAARAGSSCDAYGEAAHVGNFTDAALDEASGLTYSLVNPGLYWTHNDNNNPNDIYAVDLDGKIQATYSTSGATNRGWEDLGIGPCEDGCSCLYLAGVGGNASTSATPVVYRIPEPIVGVTKNVTAPATAMTFTYPDGAHDSETILVDPRDGHILVVTKEDDGHNRIYAFPADPTDFPVEVSYVGEAVFYGYAARDRRATGGAVAPDASRFAIRTRSYAYEWNVHGDESLEDAFQHDPLYVALPEEQQGEGISYTPDGSGLVLDSEIVPSALWLLSCAKGDAVAAPESPLAIACPDATESGPVTDNGGGCATTGVHPSSVMLLVVAGVVLARRRRALGLLFLSGTAWADDPATADISAPTVTDTKPITFSAFVQGRYTWSDSSVDGVESDAETPSNDDQFSYARLRVRSDWRPKPWAGALAEVELTEKHFRAEEVVAQLVDVWTPGHFVLGLGQFVLPFGQELAISLADLEFPDVSPFYDELFPYGRDRGADLSGHYGPVEGAVAIVNGNGIQDDDTHAYYEDDGELKSAGKIDFSADDRDHHKDVVGRVGVVTPHVKAGVSGYHGSWGALPVLDQVKDPMTGDTIYDGVNDVTYIPKTRLGADGEVRFTLLQPIGETVLRGEYVHAHGVFVDGVEADVPAYGWYALVSQHLTRWGAVSLRYSITDPDTTDSHATEHYMEPSVQVCPGQALSLMAAYQYKTTWGDQDQEALLQLQGRM